MSDTGVVETPEIVVISHDGYRGNERPAAVVLDGENLVVAEIEDAWIATGVARDSEVVRGFRVRCIGGARFRLTFTEQAGWRAELLRGPRSLPAT